MAITIADRTPFPGPVAISMANPRMPELVLSADLLESLQRSVAAYHTLSRPDFAILLDAEPVEIAIVSDAGLQLPIHVLPGTPVQLVFAPVTAAHGVVHWRLEAEIAFNGGADRLIWDLKVTAETGMVTYAPHSRARPGVPVYQMFPDHWDPASPSWGESGSDDADFTIAAHTASDGKGFLVRPVRSGPEPETGLAAELRARGDSAAASGDLESAAIAYQAASEEGSAAAAYGLAMVERARGNAQEALHWYQKAAERRIFPAFNDAGALAFQLGDAERAERWFRWGMDEGDWTAAVNLAKLIARRGDVAGAETLLVSASKVRIADAAQALAGLLIEQDRIDEAEAILVGALRRKNDEDAFGPVDPAQVESVLFCLIELALNQRQDLSGTLDWLRQWFEGECVSLDGLLAAAEILNVLSDDLIKSSERQVSSTIEVCKLRAAIHRRLSSFDESAYRVTYEKAVEDWKTT